jgi:hypothetical protein
MVLLSLCRCPGNKFVRARPPPSEYVPGLHSVLVIPYNTTRFESLTAASNKTIMSRLRVGCTGFDSWQGKYISLCHIVHSGPVGPTKPFMQCVSRVLSTEVKRSRPNADHEYLFITIVGNAWSYNFTPPFVFIR